MASRAVRVGMAGPSRNRRSVVEDKGLNDGEKTIRWRGGVLTLTLLLVLSLLAEAFVPLVSTAAPKADKDASISRFEPQRHKNDKKDRLKLRGVDAQIVGGTIAPPGKFPFMAGVVEVTDEGEFLICGGSLIDPSFVLTAAHCVTDEFGVPFPAEDFEVIAGEENLLNLTDENFREVVDIVVHPGWDPQDPEAPLDNDVAVMELDGAFPGSIAQPIRFVGSGQTSLDGPGREAVVAGWGQTSANPQSGSDQLREATLELVSGGTCGDIFSEFDSSIMLCATAPNRDTCFGDSGGPLVVKEQVGTKKKKRKKGKHRKHKKKRIPIFESVQSGIVSFGSEECDTAGAYTRLTAPGINDFIVDAINP
jgi:secreted trypsin-like serine protease